MSATSDPVDATPPSSVSVVPSAGGTSVLGCPDTSTLAPLGSVIGLVTLGSPSVAISVLVSASASASFLASCSAMPLAITSASWGLTPLAMRPCVSSSTLFSGIPIAESFASCASSLSTRRVAIGVALSLGMPFCLNSLTLASIFVCRSSAATTAADLSIVGSAGPAFSPRSTSPVGSG